MSATVQAGEPDLDAPIIDDVDPAGIYKGTETQGCAWPTTVAVVSGGGLCTGTLIHPYIVSYAAHCGDGNKSILFGNSSQTPAKNSSTEYCMINPGYGGVNDQAHDWAFCKLKNPVFDIPITPVVMGCEGSQYLTQGAQIAIVGFGDNINNTGNQTKRWAMTTLNGIQGNVAHVAGNGLPSICPGDSGGPAFVQYNDGTWHAFGIASTVQGGCGGPGQHSLLPLAVSWIEEQSGYDVTPCHTASGVWDPGPNCGGFATSGPQGYGEWSTWCEGTPASGSSSTCGDPFDAVPDTTPPVVTVLQPIHEMMYSAGESLTIEMSAFDDGWGVTSAWITINDMDQMPLYFAPYKYGAVQFPKGTYTLIGRAEDAAGNIGESAPVVIYVDVEPGSTTSGDASTTGGDSGSDSDPSAGPTSGSGDASTGDPSVGDPTGVDVGTDGDTDSGLDTSGDGKGCGCRAPARAPAGSLASLMVLGVALLGRRRRRHLRGPRRGP